MKISVIKPSVGAAKVIVSQPSDIVEVVESSAATMAEARRSGFLRSSGNYVCYGDNWLEHHEDVLAENPDVVVSTSEKDMTAEKLLFRAVREVSADFLEGLAFSRRMFTESGAWCPPEITFGEDKVLAVALLAHAESVAMVPPSKIIPREMPKPDDSDIDSLVAAASEIEGFLRRHGRYERCRRQLDRYKMSVKARLIKLRGMKAAKGLFKETDPSVAEGSDINFLMRFKLLRTRF